VPQKNETEVKDVYDLADVFCIIWKQKFLIFGGTLLFCTFAAVASMIATKIYEVKATIRPGVIAINKSGKIAYFDNADNLATLIQSGALDRSIIGKLKRDGSKAHNSPLRFSTEIPKKSRTIKIVFRTPDVEYGKKILTYLLEVLEEKYVKRVQYFQKQNRLRADTFKLKMLSLEMKKESEDRKIALLNSRIEDLKNSTAAIAKHTDDPKVLEILNVYKRELFESYLQLENFQQKKGDIESRIADEKAGIALEESKNDIITAIQIIQKPYSSSKPTKPKIKLNITLALLAGLFLMIFIAFLIDLRSKKLLKRPAN
jgi:capsular polysaccharide biosynthesis protein